MNIILFDDDKRINLLPLCLTRPAADLRVGIWTISEKWAHYLKGSSSFLTENYLSKKFPVVYSNDNLYINGRLLPSPKVVQAIQKIEQGSSLVKDGMLLAHRSNDHIGNFNLLPSTGQEYKGNVDCINFTYDLFQSNKDELEKDFEAITSGRKSAALSKTNTHIGTQLFIEKGAKVEGSIFDSTTGPIYIGKDATVSIGSLVQGGLALCEGASLKMGAKIYGATTVGPACKVGGEVNNVVFQANTNKGHDGFIGNSAIGEWCNLGADTNSSNLKNNYAEVKLWNYGSKRFAKTGLQFCGLIMGDHSKCGINTMFNTGTVVGVSANIYGAGFPRNYIPSFTWGGSSGFATYSIGKAFETAEKVMQRRNKEFDQIEREILIHVFESSLENRFWENTTKRA